MKSLIYVTSQVVGFHRWVAAPAEVNFLRDYHRHVFHVKVAVHVNHLDRQVEFFILKRQVTDFLQQTWEDKLFDLSCEQMAKTLLQQFSAEWVEVSEDGENGAIIYSTPASRVRTACFVGIEAEGPHRGEPTLFVPGSCTLQRLEGVIKRLSAHNWLPRAVYYGAGNDHAINDDVVARLLASWNYFDVVTIETWKPETFITQKQRFEDDPDRELLIVSLKQGQEGSYDYYKEVTDSDVVWSEPGSGLIIMTPLSDPMFDQDFVVE